MAEPIGLTLTSPAFKHNGSIPTQYTCTGSNINPPLIIDNAPAQTESLVLIVHDPDAPAGDWSHWAVYNISPTMKAITENSIPGQELINDFGKVHYSGPCPPSGTHRYRFELYALDSKLNISKNSKVKDLLQVIQGHVLTKAELVGLYKK